MPRPRVGLDARLWRHTGIGRYISCLVPRLADAVELVAWVSPGEAAAAREAWPGVEVRGCPAPLFSLAEQWFWRRTLPGERLRLFHAPHLNAPLWPGVPQVVTLHDLIPLRFPGTTRHPLGALYVKLMTQAAPLTARRLVTHAEATRQELVTRLGVDPSHVAVVPLAAAERFFAPPDAVATEAVRRRFDLPGPFVLYVGQWKRYKNLETLMAAFATVVRGHPEARLVLVGQEDPQAPHVPRAIAAHGLAGHVVCTGAIDDGTLLALYQTAAALAFPSRAEGFGLPPLEAMAAGAPVVCSDAAALQEALGPGAWQVPVDDVAGWAAALSALLGDEGLRASWAARGRAHAARRSWDDVARETLEAYRSAW